MIDELALADWRRRIAELYARVRASTDRRSAWVMWVETRNEMFRSHPQSPIDPPGRQEFRGLSYYDYSTELRFTCSVEPVPSERYDIETSAGTAISFTRFGRVTFDLIGRRCSLEVYQLDGYGGGIYLPFRDATSGGETYGGGRYLLDTVEGADLGGTTDELELDFNFAYNPSCAYDPRWICPLAPPPNRLTIPIRAGEKGPR